MTFWYPFDIEASIGLVECQLGNVSSLSDMSENMKLWMYIPPNYVTDRSVFDWRVVWLNVGYEAYLTKEDKSLIDNHLRRLKRLRAFL